MQFRTYPKSDLKVSEVGFGLWTTATGWWGQMTDDEAVALLHEAFDLGITLYDAADTYGNGRSETQLAKAFAGRRDKVVYSTKFGYDWYTYGGERKGQTEIPQDFSPDFVRFALEQSLKRLQTETIDIYAIHNARLAQIESDELFALLEDLKREGKIRMYGVALGPAIGWLVEGCEAAKRRDAPSVQMIYNILEQYPGNEMIRAANDAHASTGYQIRVPHSSGMLEGKYTLETTFPPGDHRSHRPHSWLVNGVKKIETLRFLERPDRTLGQAALQWLLAEPRVMTVLPNIYDREQLIEFAKAPDTPRLSPGELARIAELAAENFGVEEPPMKYKGTMSYEALTAPVGAST
jgi:aryl-alcohol dehydrogenase-like predicted oxidoreductase